MSHNLMLVSGNKNNWIECSLYQTPTDVTEQALFKGKDPKAVYFAWLDAWVESVKPPTHPRASNAIRKRMMSGQAWKDYESLREEVRENKAQVEAFLIAHPNARWCGW